MTGWRRPRPLVMPGLQSAASLLNTRMTRPDVIEQPRPKVRRRRRLCLGCPFLAPSGKCLDARLKSGRCGDWIFYVWGGKQFRHLDVKPHDPRTPSQRCCRNRLTGASRRYSRSLSEAERAACIAAGAKRRSRKRLGQCGRLTGQQHWVGKECARLAEAVVADVQSASKPLETKGNSIPTWERHRGTSLVAPWQLRGGKQRAGREGQESEVQRPKQSPMRCLNCTGARVSATPGTKLSTLNPHLPSHSEAIEGAFHSSAALAQHVRIDHRRGHVIVPHQLLDRPPAPRDSAGLMLRPGPAGFSLP